jgi:hypothetical protein
MNPRDILKGDVEKERCGKRDVGKGDVEKEE